MRILKHILGFKVTDNPRSSILYDPSALEILRIQLLRLRLSRGIPRTGCNFL